MADKTEGEERCRSDSGVAAAPAAPPSPCTDSRSPFPLHKKLLVGLKRKGKTSLSSTSSPSSVRLRNPNLSDCHVCGFRMISSNKGKPKLQTLDSQWRIVLLCEKCLCSIQSAKICSYCFVEMSEVGVSCFDCKCRVHEGCVSMYRGFRLGSSFTCVDCWVPKSLNRVCRRKKPKGDSKIELDACSVKSSSVSLAAGNFSKSLEDLVRDANSTAQTKIATAARAREKALKKGLAATRVAELAQNALDLLTARGKTEVKDPPLGSNSVVDDVQLAFRLHRAMNSSPRISKISCQLNSNHLVSRKMLRCNGDSLGRVSGGCRSASGKIEVCSDNKIFENPDKAVPEVSARIGMLDHDSSTGMGFMEARKTADIRETPQDEEQKGNGEDIVMGNNGRGLNEGLLLDNEDSKVVQPVKEEQASCSNKESSSCGDDNSMNSGDQSFQKQVGLDNNLSLSTEILSQSACNIESSNLEKRRCTGPDHYLRKYSKKNSSLNTILPAKSKFLYENFPLESQASASGLPLLQVDCSKASRTFSEASFQSSAAPFQASRCSSGPSEC